MWDKRVPQRRLIIWILAAASAPLLSVAGNSGWLSVLVLAVLCGTMVFCVQSLCDGLENRVVCALQWAYLGVLLGSVARYSAVCWEDGSPYPVVPLVLLALAAFSARSGGAKASRVGAVLIWFVVPIIGLVLGAGVNKLETKWMTPVVELPTMLLVPVLLLPCIGVFVPGKCKKGAWILPVAIGLLGTLVSFWVNSSISPQVVAEAENAFYQYCKGISLFGVAKRFEALVSCGLTAGWFALFGFCSGAAGHLAQKVRDDLGAVGVWGCAAVAAAVMLCKVHIETEILAILSIIFWVMIPILAQIMEWRKRSKKCKKTIDKTDLF